MRRLADFDWRQRAALLRSDLNVPLASGRIADASRIEASLPSVKSLLAAGAGIVMLSHLGRPDPGKPQPELSLAPIAELLSELLGQKVAFIPSLPDCRRPAAGEVLLLENTRFNSGEKSNSPELAQQYAQHGDIFVMDAFASAHRAEASTVALARAAPMGCCAGELLRAELDSLHQALSEPARPLLAVIGGAKISTKLPVLERLAELADCVIVGGALANTMLAAAGCAIGRSLDEPASRAAAQQLLAKRQAKFLLPEDVVIAAGPEAAAAATVAATEVPAAEMILDVGAATCRMHAKIIKKAGTVIWNGALGLFENPLFATGTRRLAEAIASSPAYALAGGGETIACINQFQLAGKLGYLSTGGGAFLEFIEGRSLPAVAALN